MNLLLLFSNQSGKKWFKNPVSPPSYGSILSILESIYLKTAASGLIIITPALKLSGGNISGEAAKIAFGFYII